MTILVTGGAGFIGSHYILDWLSQSTEPIVNLDKLTYAANLHHLKKIEQDARYHFVQGDIADPVLLPQLLEKHAIRAVIHFAAESHVDNSIASPAEFMHTNILGTFQLLEACRHYSQKNDFRFIHISTDEVFGALAPNELAFTEMHRFQPNSPYSASKAASDHLARAYYHTYNLPVITTNCSNNYGPHQCAEKLIPKIVQQAINGKALTIYGNGQQVRDWLFVNDHCAAIRSVLEKGKVGETYNIGGNNEKTNLEVVHAICDILNEVQPRQDKISYKEQIQFVADRPGHDVRYAINAEKIQRELGWTAQEHFLDGLRKTVLWYLAS